MLRKIFDVIRYNEWWEFKFPTILVIGYIVLLHSNYSFIQVWYGFVIIMMALFTGAAYVSIINDITDVADDFKAGKRNRAELFTLYRKFLVVSIPVVIAIVFIAYFYSLNLQTAVFYVLAYICFTLYSLPPVRLKKRGFLGILADASGSQAFPTLFVSAYLLTITHQQFLLSRLSLVGIWSLCFGLRGILCHQLYDADNDRKSGTTTYIQKLNSAQIALLGKGIIVPEFVSFLLIVILNRLYVVFIFLCFYLVYLILLNNMARNKCVILNPPGGAYNIFMLEFYQVFFPLAVLMGLVIKDPVNIILLLLHVLLFPNNIKTKTREIKNLLTGRSSLPS